MDASRAAPSHRAREGRCSPRPPSKTVHARAEADTVPVSCYRRWPTSSRVRCSRCSLPGAAARCGHASSQQRRGAVCAWRLRRKLACCGVPGTRPSLSGGYPNSDPCSCGAAAACIWSAAPRCIAGACQTRARAPLWAASPGLRVLLVCDGLGRRFCHGRDSIDPAEHTLCLPAFAPRRRDASRAPQMAQRLNGRTTSRAWR